MIQFSICENDDRCKPCLDENSPSYCFAEDNYNALITCSICSCVVEEDEEFEECKSSPFNNDSNKYKPIDSSVKPCTNTEVMQGSKAIMDYAKCSKVDASRVSTFTSYESLSFDLLNDFTECATNVKEGRRSWTALDCFRLLVHGMDNNDSMEASIAKDLYTDASSFCDCSYSVSGSCPVCEDFINMKTLLLETLNVCRALDDIDCAAWNEFGPQCEINVKEKYGRIDFKNQAQCK